MRAFESPYNDKATPKIREMKIGDLAAAAETPVQTVRHYEREGLLPPPARTASNYRSYEDEHLQRLQFIRYCRSLDMALEEIRVLLRFKDSPQESYEDVNAILDERIRHVARRIRELRALDKELKVLRTKLGGVSGKKAAASVRTAPF